MAENVYENVQKSQTGLSESVVILENPEDTEDTELNMGIAKIVASPTVQIMDQHNQVIDLQYEHVEEIRSTKNKNLLQLTSKNQTYFIKFNSRESLTDWLKIFKTTLHVSGISRQRASTERQVRDKKYAETHRNRLSTQYVQTEYPRAEEQDCPIYDDTATPATQDEREKVKRCVPTNGGHHTSVKEAPECKVFINQMHGDFYCNREPLGQLFNSKTASPNRYQDLCPNTVYRPPTNYGSEFEHRPMPFDGLRSYGPTEGLFNVRKFQNYTLVEDESEKGEYEALLQSAPSAIVCRYNKLAEEHKPNSHKSMNDLLKKKLGRDVCLKMKFTSVDSNVFVSDTPKDDKCLYVGDRIHAINGIEVSGDASFTEKLIQGSTSKMVEITLSRLPRAEIGLIKRHFNDQPIGITLKGTKISNVGKGSAFADKFGHSTHRCVTHINGIYFAPGTSEKTVYKKLGETASEFFIVVQPTCFIDKLTKKLSKT